MSSILAFIPGHYNKSLAYHLHFSIPKCACYMIFSISRCSVLGMMTFFSPEHDVVIILSCYVCTFSMEWLQVQLLTSFQAIHSAPRVSVAAVMKPAVFPVWLLLVLFLFCSLFTSISSSRKPPVLSGRNARNSVSSMKSSFPGLYFTTRVFLHLLDVVASWELIPVVCDRSRWLFPWGHIQSWNLVQPKTMWLTCGPRQGPLSSQI